MQVCNYTPHNITIIDSISVKFKPEIRKYVTDAPVILKTIPSSGVLNVSFDVLAYDPLDGIPVRNKVRSTIDPIPEDCDVAIVSGLYASATNDQRAYSIIDPVYSLDGRTVIGCLAIGKVL